MRRLIRYYEFLTQVSSFEDVELHKKYRYLSYLLAFINLKNPGGGFNLDGKLKASAKNNTVQDFEFSYFDDIDDALIEGLEQNQDFFSLLLSNDEIKHEVLGIFTEEIYKALKNS